MTIKIVCLANSYMKSNRCIAGKSYNDDGTIGCWLRPVNPAHPARGITANMDRDPQVLDIIEIPLNSGSAVADPANPHQLENRAIAKGKWKLIREAEPDILENCLDRKIDNLWGSEKYVPENRIKNIKSSLCLIKVDTLSFHTVPKTNSHGDNYEKLRAKFQWVNSHYDLPVTDDYFISQYFNTTGKYTDKTYRAYLCVSLGTNFDRKYYKLVASVIQPEEVKSHES